MIKRLLIGRASKRVVSTLLAIAMSFSTMSVGTFSEDEPTPSDIGEVQTTVDENIGSPESNEEPEISENGDETPEPQTEEMVETENNEIGTDSSVANDNSAEIPGANDSNTEDENNQETSEAENIESVSSEIQKISVKQIAADNVSVTVEFTDDLADVLYYEISLDGILVSVINFGYEQKINNLTTGKKYSVQIRGYDRTGNVLADSGIFDVYTSISTGTLIEDAVVYSANINSGGSLDLNGHSLTVLNDLLLTYGTLNINGGSLYVKGDFNYQNTSSSYSTGYLQMQNASDYVLVDGNFTIQNYYDIEGYMTEGILEIKGDFTQTSGTYEYKPSGSHKTLFTGTEVQTIFLANRLSRFNILELQNTFGVVFGSEIQYNELIANDSKITYEAAEPVKYDWTLENDETIDGDYNILSENVDLNGYTLTINGDLIQAGGILKINGGNLIVSGDYRMQNELVGSEIPSNGLLNMTNVSDYVTIGGNFIAFSNVSHEGFLTAGTLEIKGNIRDITRNIYASGTHTIILSGNKTQRSELNSSSQINNLKIQSLSKRYIDNYNTLNIAGELNMDENSLFTNPDYVRFLPTAKLNVPVWNGNLTLDNPIEIMQDIKIEGNVNIYNYNSTIKKWMLTHDLEADGHINFNNNGIDVEIIDADIISGGYVRIYCKDFNLNSDITAKEYINLSASGGFCEISGTLNSSDSYIYVNSKNLTLSGKEIKSQDYIDLYGTDITVNTKDISAETYISLSGTNFLIGSENISGELRLGNRETALTGNVTITGDVLMNSTTLNPNGNKLSIFGDLTAQYGRIQMQNAEDYILVSGGFNCGNSNTTGQFTAGTLELKGDFVQDNVNYGFVASGTHKTVFSGIETQTVTLESIKSALNIVEIINTSEEGVIFANAVSYNELIDENNKAHFNEAVGLNRTLTADETIDGDFIFTDGELNLSGFTLTVNGNFIHSGGTINIGSGKLVINGDYGMEILNEDGSFSQSKSILKMSDENGLIDASGGFIYNSVYSSYSNITAGTIQVGGNVKLTNFNINSSGNNTFELTGTTKQTLSGTGIYFDNFKISNTSPEGIDISTTVYISGTLFNTDTPISNSSNIWLYGGSVDGGVWNYDLTLYNITLFDNMHIKGNVYGQINMKNPDDCLVIDGDLNISSSSSLTNGVLEVKGDISQGDNAYITFIASNNHKTILSGNKLQTIKITHANSAFNVLEIKNYSEDSVVFLNDAKISELITNGCKVTFSSDEIPNIIEQSITLKKDSVFTGDLYLNAGTLDLAGFCLTVNGNIIHSGGTMNINGGTLSVHGNYRIQSEKQSSYTSSTGILNMQNDADTVNIIGSFIVQSTVQSRLTAGTMNIGGNVEQLSGYIFSLNASGSHTIVLNGSSEQRISIYYPTYSVLRNLTIENTSDAGVSFQSNVYVSGEFTDNANKLKSLSYLVMSGGIYNPSEYNGNLNVASSFTLGSDLTVKGNLIINGGMLNLNGHKLTVTGNYVQSSGNFTLHGDVIIEGNAIITEGTLSLNGRKLIINGSLTNNTSKVYNSYYSGHVKMTNTNDYLFVGGDFYTATVYSTQNNYTAGTLEIKGDFTQVYSTTSYNVNKYSFYANGTHKVLLSGDELQTVHFDNLESKFGILEITNTSDEGVVFSTPVTYSRIITNNSNITYHNNLKSGWTLEGDEVIDTDLNLGSGVLNLNGYTLTINGSLNQYAGRVTINGGKLIINGDYLIEGQNNGEISASSGVLSMLKYEDLVSVSGDFVMQSSVSHKFYLTAGTLEIGGDFIEKRGGSTTDFFASGSHKVVLNGDTAQTVSIANYDYCTVNSLTLKNTSAEGITFANTVYVTGELVNDNSVLNSSERIYVTGSASFPTSEWKGDFTIASRIDLPGDFILENPLTVDGTLTIKGNFTANEPLTVNANLIYNSGNTTINDGIYVKGAIVISSPAYDNQVFKLNSEMNVDGDVLIHCGILNVNGQTLNIGGDLSLGNFAENANSYSIGYIKMTNAEDRVNVNGDFSMNTNVGTSGFLTNGILDIKGDFLQYTSDNVNNGFYATGNHRTILSGNGFQEVVFDSAKSKFAILEIKNFSDDGIVVNNSISYTELITNDCKITYVGVEKTGWKLTSNEITDGDLYLTTGTLDLNGFTLTVTGNLVQSGGTVYINGGTLDIAGDYRIQNKTGETFVTSVGILKMTDIDDIVKIGGGFTTQSRESHDGFLTAGKMYVAGDFIQLLPSINGINRNPYYDHNFYTTGSHTVILNGTEEQNVNLCFGNSYRHHSAGDYDYFARFRNLTIENTSEEGVNFTNAVRVYGEISNRSSKLQNIGNLNFTLLTAVVGGIWADDLYINDYMTLSSDLEITGDLYLNNNLNLNGHTLSVCGNVIHKSGTLTIGGGKLYIDGNYEYSYSNYKSNGIISMINVDDYMLVGGNYNLQTYGNSSNNLTAGVLEIRGNIDFRYYSSNATNTFTASGSHKTLLSGDNVQTVSIQGSDSTFNILEITKDFDTGYIFTNLRFNELIESKPDMELPVIKSISVPKTYINGNTSISVSAYDNASVKSITLQYSLNGELWFDYTTIDNINRNSITKDISFQNSTDGTYFIRAVTTDSKGNVSDVETSPYVTVVVDRTRPAAPYSVVSSVANSRIKISWEYDIQNDDVDYFRIYRKTAATSYVLYSDNYKNTSFTDNNYNTGITYSYIITAIDKAGNVSNDSNEVSVIVHYDKTPPVKPILTAENIEMTSAVLSWNSSDNIAITSYSLYRNGILYRTITDNTFTDTTLSPDTEYSYYVIATDASDNKSDMSNVLSVYTGKDDIVPTVTAITTTLSGKNVIIGVSASDNHSVTSVAIEYSSNSINWENAQSVNASASTSVKVSASIDISDFTDGKLFFRAIAIDSAENKSVSDSTQIAEIIVDNTSPAKPSKVTTDNDGYTVGLKLGQPIDADFSYYRIYRSADSTNYILLRDNYRYADFYDNTTEPGETYYYKISSVDTSGNESELSDALIITMPADTTAPRIASIVPTISNSDYEISVNEQISLSLIDDFEIVSFKAALQKSGETEGKEIVNKAINKSSEVVRFSIDTASMTTGIYTVTMKVTDNSGNITERTLTFTYVESTLSVPELSVTGEGYRNILSWTPLDNDTVAGYRIKRLNTSTGVYDVIASVATESNDTAEYVDRNLTPGKTYSYMLTAVDKYGHTADSGLQKGTPTNDDDVVPIADAGIDRYDIAGQKITFDASYSWDNHLITKYVWDFGDGSAPVTTATAKTSHAYSLEDESNYNESFTLTVTVYDEAGNESSDTANIKIYSDKYGFATFRLIDIDTKGVLSGAYVYAGENGDDIYMTDSNGSVKIVVEKGLNNFYFYKGEYLPVAEEININGEFSKTIELKKDSLVTGKMEVRELAIEEVLAMGVDITKPENQHVYSYDVEIKINPRGNDTKIVNIVINGDGEIIPTSGYIRAVHSPDEITNSETNPEKFTTLPDDAKLYDGEANVNITVFKPNRSSSSGGGGSGGGVGGGSGGGGGSSAPPEAEIPILAMFRVATDISWNKEFYNIDLTIMNNASSEFVIRNSQATLNVPAGLSLPTTNGNNDVTRNMGEISGGSSSTISWILRGDKSGSYEISSDFTGTLEPLGLPVVGNIKSADPIVVEGGNAMEFKTINTVITGTNTYIFEFMLTNVSDEDITGLRIEDVFTQYVQGIEESGEASSRILTLPDGTELLYGDDGTKDILLPALGVEIDYEALEKMLGTITLKPGEYVIGKFTYTYYYGENKIS